MRIEIRDPQRVQRLRAIVAAGVITARESAENGPSTVHPGAPDPEDPTPKPFAPAYTIPGAIAK